MIGTDKTIHFCVGLLIGLCLGSHILWAILAVFLAGAGKELYDYLYNKITKTSTHGVELLDAVSTFVGGGVGIGIIYLLNFIL